VQGDGADLSRNLENLARLTIQLLITGKFTYRDLLSLEIKEREQLLNSLVKVKEEEADAIKNSMRGARSGVSRFR